MCEVGNKEILKLTKPRLGCGLWRHRAERGGMAVVMGRVVQPAALNTVCFSSWASKHKPVFSSRLCLNRVFRVLFLLGCRCRSAV